MPKQPNQPNQQVISLGQVVVDFTMRVPYVPTPGGDVFATDQSMHVGGSFNTLFAVRQMQQPAAWAGVLGTGAMADRIEAALAAEHITHLGLTDETHDNGMSIALTDANGERTFVSTRGAECFGDASAFAHIHPAQGDVVHISGYTLMHPIGDALREFLRRTTPAHRDFQPIFDPGPLMGQVSDSDLQLLMEYEPMWTCNEEESELLAQRLACSKSDLAQHLHAPVIIRCGKKGALVMLPSDDATRAHTTTIDGYPVTAVDTNGAGDCHTGVLAAELLRGANLLEAVRVANVAAALAVTRRGPATCPTREEILHAMAATAQ